MLIGTFERTVSTCAAYSSTPHGLSCKRHPASLTRYISEPTIPEDGEASVANFSPFLYKYRNLVERFFGKIKHFRTVVMRYDKDSDDILASFMLAAMRVWSRVSWVRDLILSTGPIQSR
jgi:transposase